MLNLELLGTGEPSRSIVKKDDIEKALKNLRMERREFIRLCLSGDPENRPKASQLLKNPVLQEVGGRGWGGWDGGGRGRGRGRGE